MHWPKKLERLKEQVRLGAHGQALGQSLQAAGGLQTALALESLQ